MKQYLYFAILALFVSSCADEPGIQPENTESSNSEFLVSQDKAIDAILEFFGDKQSETRSKAYSLKFIENQATRNFNTPCGFYLANFENGQGFALISADKRDTSTIYMFSDKGNLNLDIPESSRQFVLERCKEYQAMKVQQYDPKKYQPITRPDIVIEYQTTYDTIQYVCPIIDKEWNQSEPFNVSLEGTQFEGCPMGCGPLAIALICTNFRRPYQYDGYIYNWELIDQMNNAYDLMSNSMGAYAVSKLIKDVGTMSSVEYYPTGSPINSEGLENALDECGFKFNEPTTFEAGYNNTVYSLQLRQAVIMTGNTSAGHAWVLDGLMKITEDVKAYDQDGNPIPNTILEEHNYQTERDYVHCNMGWGGILNGYKYSAYEKNAELAPTLTYIYSNIFKNINNETYSNLTVYNGITPKI